MMSRPGPTALSHSFARKVVVPVFACAAVVSLVVAGLIVWSTREVDTIAVGRQESLVTLVFSQLRTRVGYDQESVTVWDDAVEAVRDPDAREWVDHNLGVWMHTYFGFDGAYIIDPLNKPTYAFADGSIKPASAFGEIEEAVAPLVETVRNKMRAGAEEGDGGRMLSPGAADLAVVQGHPAVISVKPIVSDTGEIEQVPGEEYLHVGVRYLDGGFLAELEKEYLFNGMRFSGTNDAVSGESNLPLHSLSGEVIGHFIWQPNRPGMAVLLRLTPVFLAILAVVLATIASLLFVLHQRSRKLAASEAKMEYLALHDPLTGLPNRAFFDDCLDRALQEVKKPGEMLAVLYLDLDRFKQVNDTLGHPSGDILIKDFAARLRRLTREPDVVGRIGGDEFIIMVPQIRDVLDIQALCDRIIDSVRQPFDIDGNQVFAGVSIGVSVAPNDGDERTELTRKADIALYHAKSSGRGRYAIFGKAMDALLQARRDVERDLRVALANEEITVHYQPLHSATEERITGVEALLRWKHPMKGWIPPAIFIPIAEETGLIDALGQYVLKQACRAAAAWPDLNIAVNVSAIELRNPAYVTKVAEALTANRIEPRRLELEVTETALHDSAGHCERNIRALREMGVRIALDDFGTGFSSIGRLQQLEVDRIKIDRSFVNGFGRSSGEEAIVQAIVNLAHAKGLSTTAEGVETTAQEDYLKTIGCDELQGFLFSRALPMEEIDRLVGARRRRGRMASAA